MCTLKGPTGKGIRYVIQSYVPLTILCFIILYLGSIYVIRNSSRHQSRQACEQTLASQEVIWENIFLLTPFYGRDDGWEKLLKRLIVGRCPQSKCRLTSNISELSTADAVLLNAVDLPSYGITNSEVLDKRQIRQRWIFVSLEPPPIVEQRVDLASYNGFFNWTMTYKPDSDIFVPYGTVLRKRPTKRFEHYLNSEPSEDHLNTSSVSFLHREKLSLIVFSRCDSVSNRFTFIKEIKRYMSVDVFGKCGKEMPGKKHVFNIVEGQPEESEKIIPNYYFYFAFETANCDHFLTEHFYRALRLGVVPVVMGGVSIIKGAPSGSYIDASKFGSAFELSKYLKEVAKNPQLYTKFHEWRKSFYINIGYPYVAYVCDLCSKLHKKSIKRQVIRNLKTSFSSKECKPYESQ